MLTIECNDINPGELLHHLDHEAENQTSALFNFGAVIEQALPVEFLLFMLKLYRFCHLVDNQLNLRIVFRGGHKPRQNRYGFWNPPLYVKPPETISLRSNEQCWMTYLGVSGRKGMVDMVTRAKTIWKAMGNLQTTLILISSFLRKPQRSEVRIHTSPVKFLTVP